MIKKELRILGIDDAPFSKSSKQCLVIATVFRGGQWLDGLLSCKVRVDGQDATSKLISMIKKSRHLEQLQCIMLDGICLAGFNVVDIQQLSQATKLPVIVLIRKRPNFKAIAKALQLASKKTASQKLKLMRKAGKIYELKLKDKKIYFQVASLEPDKAAEIIKTTATHALIPEPIRVAHLIASGVVLGESRGRA